MVHPVRYRIFDCILSGATRHICVRVQARPWPMTNLANLQTAHPHVGRVDTYEGRNAGAKKTIEYTAEFHIVTLRN